MSQVEGNGSVSGIEELITNLKASNLTAECRNCGGEFDLSEALLFDGLGRFPDPAEQRKLLLLKKLKEAREELKKRKISAGVGAEKKAIASGFGKNIEKFIPGFKNLDLEFYECRPLFDPIDLIVFKGLIKRKVESITFLEVKSGGSRLNKHQKMIRDAVQDGRVSMRVL